MGSMPTDVLLLKLEGNTHTKNGKYIAAIECYDEALKRTKSQSDATILLLNRCHARLQSQHYDSALGDALAVIDLSPSTPPEKALYRAARALYGLQRWQESLNYFTQVLSLNPANKAAGQDISRCKTRIRESTGDYDFQAMLDEASSKAPHADMDRADFVGPIEVRECEIKSHGRGLFTTKAVEAGELLLCEKSFAAVFADPAQPVGKAPSKKREGNPEDEMLWQSLERRNKLVEKSLVKLHRNPSLQAAFAELYPGPDWVDERDEETGLPIMDDTAIQNRIIYNNFGFPINTHTYHWAMAHYPETIPDDLAGSRGVWLLSSYINHSCYPMVRRSFIGNTMIFRAQRHIPAHTELKFGYISGLEELDERQRKLKKYGFDCDCQICEAETKTSGGKMKKRLAIAKGIHEIFEAGEVNSLQTYTDLLDAMEGTYVNPPGIEYRRAMITPLTNLITGCLTNDIPFQVITLTHRLLLALGFQISVGDTHFQILQWGFLTDEVVVSLVDLVDAYKGWRPALVRDAQAVAKKAYLIMCGEDVSWEGAYGFGGLREKGKKRGEW